MLDRPPPPLQICSKYYISTYSLNIFSLHLRFTVFASFNIELLYVAPELLRNTYREPNYFVLQSSDVYSFGVIVYEILTRKEPFEDDLQSSSIEGWFLSLQLIPISLKFYLLPKRWETHQKLPGDVHIHVSQSTDLTKQGPWAKSFPRETFHSLKQTSANIIWI